MLRCMRVCVCAEVLVLGVGARVQRVPENVKAYLRSKAIALEVSDTVRTYECLSLNVEWHACTQ